MASNRESIEAVIAAKLDPNGSGSFLKTNSLMQYFVNHEELILIRDVLINSGDLFTEEFFNIESEEYLVWNNDKQMFYNKLNGEEYLIRIFYDQFDNIPQSQADWIFANSLISVNDWEFGTDGIDAGKINGLYISNDGGSTNAYSNDTGRSHATIQVDIPAGSKVKVKFRAKSNGNFGPDNLRCYAYNTAVTPTADIFQPGGNQEVFVADVFDFEDFEFELNSSFTGTTTTISFEWRNNGGGGIQNPPGHLSEVEILFI